jgi:exodeoxyribonuclease VII large subunit
MQARFLRFAPEDGLQVVCHGRVSLYEKRGEYQLILDSIEPKGIGALQLAFIQLKGKLEREGLFDVKHKKPIPLIPQKIGMITSPTGAVIRDMLHIINRRFENVHILLYPVRVQGEGASQEIVDGIEYFNKQMEVDVIIAGRGGGSLEDLAPFNEEVVARAIYHSRIPIISAVGHETDYTISDFVADVRAPTPSAAAELVIRDKREVKDTLRHFRGRLESKVLQIIAGGRTDLFHFRKRLIDPRKKIEEYFLGIDDLTNRFRILISRTIKGKREKSLHIRESLFVRIPHQRIATLRLLISQAEKRLSRNLRHSIEIQRRRAEGILGKLDSLSPLSILQRGYSITRKIPSLQILRNSEHVKEGDKVEVRLHRGTVFCGVERTEKS